MTAHCMKAYKLYARMFPRTKAISYIKTKLRSKHNFKRNHNFKSPFSRGAFCERENILSFRRSMSKNAPAQGLCTQLKFRVLDESDKGNYRLAIYVEDLEAPEIKVHLWEQQIYVEATRKEDSKLNPPRPLQTLSVNLPLPFNVHPDCVTASFLPDLKAILIEAPKTSNLASMTTEMPTLDKSMGSGASTPGSDFGSRQSEPTSHPFSKTLHEFVIQNYSLPLQDFMVKVKDVIDYYVRGAESPAESKKSSGNADQLKRNVDEALKERKGSSPDQLEGIVPLENQVASARVVTQSASAPSWYLPQKPDVPIRPENIVTTGQRPEGSKEQQSVTMQLPGTGTSTQQENATERTSSPINKPTDK
ncbi:hypothetical protein M514_04960 [Trichuris suis]|uniref:SHSP domain-containing protein n=1 Tax=Trichuris suis TaxID=68888 RepID=A0A085NNZ6_9BILA|nr:hypothetical protein M514_04960 [Trichuris suis]